MKKIFNKEISLTWFCLTLSIFTCAAFHIPFFRHTLSCLEGGFNAVLITGSLALIMLALNFFFYYLILFPGRTAGKCIVAFSLIGDAIMLYFVNTYEVLVTKQMMGNVFNTQYSEASGFFSFSFVLYVLLLGVLPAVYVFMQKVRYGSWKRFLANIGTALGIIVAVAVVNMKNWTWIDRNSTELGSLLMPWSYTINSIRYYSGEKKRNAKEILLPDATIKDSSKDSSKDVCILMIGESARRDHFSLYGYERQTNPYTVGDSVAVFKAIASATYTTAGVKAILSHEKSGKLYEILPNYLFRAGADVLWRTSNWGEPPVHIDKYHKVKDLAEIYPDQDSRYDGILLAGLKEAIAASDKDKILVVLHTNTSHGPTYNKKYPAEFEIFTPVCNTVEMSKTSPEELINAYDNSIVYTDYLIHSAIEILREIPDRRSCMIYISDHGESLGENNLYMHGVPMSMAPKEQLEIPFIVWTSEGMPLREIEEPGHYNIFHSVLDFLDVETPVYDESMTIFE